MADLPFGSVAEHVRVYRENAGEVGHEVEGGLRCLLLTTRGRRSGIDRTAPLLYVADGEALVVAASAGGAERHPAWYLNLCQDPVVEVQVGARIRPMRARTVADEERERRWSQLVGCWSGFEDYRKATTREIPVVVLEPA